jgi:NAD(P)-dependent dehydrogenase (short-subunit alcohol dehydrogenase family)
MSTKAPHPEDPPSSSTAPRLEERVALVTGATSGIGEVTARELARRGARVLVGGRSERTCQEAIARIRREVPEARLEAAPADLSSLAEVRALAGRVLAISPVLHLLVNNAGCYRPSRRVTPDGFEETWAVNYLAPFLLTRLLLPALHGAPTARVVNVCSEAHRHAHPDWVDLVGAPHFSGLRAYSESKLALLMFTYEMARRLHGDPLTINAVHPGLVNTQFASHGEGVRRWVLRKAIEASGMSPEEGAQTTLYVATSPLVEGVSGQYFAHSRVVASSEISHEPVLMHRLFVLTEKLVQLPPMPPVDEEPGTLGDSGADRPPPQELLVRNPSLARMIH